MRCAGAASCDLGSSRGCVGWSTSFADPAGSLRTLAPVMPAHAPGAKSRMMRPVLAWMPGKPGMTESQLQGRRPRRGKAAASVGRVARRPRLRESCASVAKAALRKKGAGLSTDPSTPRLCRCPAPRRQPLRLCPPGFGGRLALALLRGAARRVRLFGRPVGGASRARKRATSPARPWWPRSALSVRSEDRSSFANRSVIRRPALPRRALALLAKRLRHRVPAALPDDPVALPSDRKRPSVHTPVQCSFRPLVAWLLSPPSPKPLVRPPPADPASRRSRDRRLSGGIRFRPLRGLPRRAFRRPLKALTQSDSRQAPSRRKDCG